MLDVFENIESSPTSSVWSSNGVLLSACILAAEGAKTGGDWCEAFALDPGTIALSIGDVCGHGEAKFNARIAIRQSIRDAAHRGLDPAQILAAGHETLRDFDRDEFATAVFGLLDVQTSTFIFANAGHPAPLLCSESGATYIEFSETFLPLGVDGMIGLALRTVRVPEAALLVLYTDGVTEHARNSIAGAEELRDAALVAHRDRASASANVIEKYMRLANTNEDDAAILTVRMPTRTASR